MNKKSSTPRFKKKQRQIFKKKGQTLDAKQKRAFSVFKKFTPFYEIKSPPFK